MCSRVQVLRHPIVLAAPTAAAAAEALVHPLMEGAAGDDLEEQVARLPERQEDAHQAATDDDEKAKDNIEAEVAQTASARALSPHRHYPAEGHTGTSSQAPTLKPLSAAMATQICHFYWCMESGSHLKILAGRVRQGHTMKPMKMMMPTAIHNGLRILRTLSSSFSSSTEDASRAPAFLT